MATPWVTNGQKGQDGGTALPGGIAVRRHMGRQRMTIERQDMYREAIGFLLMFLSAAAFATCIFFPLLYYYGNIPHYSVAIDSASAIDHRAGLSFNLTLVVASRGHGANECIDPGMYVEVFYRCVQVAASDGAETRRTCARPRNMAELPVVAKATMLPVGKVLDSLAAEMGQGAAVFDLRLITPSYGRNGMLSLWASDCKGGRVGDAAVPCDSHTYAKTI